MASADTSIFSLRIGSIPLDTFRVIEFQGEEILSQMPRFRILAVAKDKELTYDDAIEADATLIVRGNQYEVTHHGIITSFSQVPEQDEDGLHISYEFILEPRLKALDFVVQSRIFQGLTPKQIVLEVLEAYYPDDGSAYKWVAEDDWTVRDYVVQYNESDLAFIQRLMEDEGIHYFFDHSGRQEVMVIANKPEHAKPILHTPEVRFQPETGMVTNLQEYCESMTRYVRKVMAKATFKDFNPKTPGVTVMGSHVNKVLPDGHPTGEYYQYGAYLNTPDEATRKAKLRAEMLSCGKETYRGTGVFRGARAGFRFKLKESGAEKDGGFDGEYLLVKVNHIGVTEDPEEGGDGQPHTHYRNAFECVKGGTVYRPPLLTARPTIPGLLTALIEGPEDKYGSIDDEGRYHAKFFFDRSDKKDDKSSRPIRLASPYGGANYGLHMPLHKGVEIALGFVAGDPDRPIALGAVPNPQTGSPVVVKNKSESVIRTASGHQIRLDDMEKKTVIDVTTQGKHKLSMNDDKDAQEIRLTSTDLNELVFDDTNKNIRIATPDGAHLVKLDYDKKVLTAETKYGHKLTMDDEAKRIAVQTKDGHILSLDDDKNTLTLQDGKGKHVFQIDVGGSAVSITTDGDLSFKAKGALNIEAKEITMEAKSGAINAKAKADVVLDGMNVSAKGKQKIALEGTAEASLKGAQTKVEGQATLELKATGQAKLSGMQVSVAGQVMSEMKGAMVMIN